MSISVVGRRYARALIALADEQQAVEQVGQDLRDFATAFAESRELQNLFSNPVFGVETRRDVLREIATASKMHAAVRDTLLLLSDRQRMGSVEEVAEAYEATAEARSGRVRAEVTTAEALPDAYFEELTKVLKQVTGKDVVIARTVDPTLIGGVVTRIGDQVFDGSVKNRLSGLKEELLS